MAGGAKFSPEQLNVARGLLSAPQYRGAGPKVKLALGETGLTESNLSRDPTENSEGSAGPLQQTPKDGWGTLQQVTNPRYAAEAFLRKAIPLAGKYGTAGQLAQAVQRSAFPERYDQHSAEAAQLLAMLGGNSAPHAALSAMGAGAAPPQTEVPGPSAAQSADLVQLMQSLTQPSSQSSSLAETPLARPSTSGGPEQAAGTPRVPSPLTPAAAPASSLDAQLALVQKIGEDATPEAAATEGGISQAAPQTNRGISQGAASGQRAAQFGVKAIGKYAESEGSNLGPELNKLESQYGDKGAPWCAIFATTAAAQGGASKAARTASVASINQWAQEGSHGYEKGLRPSSQAQPGDLLTFGNAHVALVKEVRGGKIITIEGNADGSGGVVQLQHSVGEGQIARPRY